MQYLITVAGEEFKVDSDVAGQVVVGESAFTRRASSDGRVVVIDHSGSLYPAVVEFSGEGSAIVYVANHRVPVSLLRPSVQRAMEVLHIRSQSGAEGSLQVVAPMPGMVRKVLVESGSAVEAGSVLFILEAMKMENEVRCSRSGTITVNVAAGTSVEKGRVLAEVS